jgi:hypothetical protein
MSTPREFELAGRGGSNVIPRPVTPCPLTRSPAERKKLRQGFCSVAMQCICTYLTFRSYTHTHTHSAYLWNAPKFCALSGQMYKSKCTTCINKISSFQMPKIGRALSCQFWFVMFYTSSAWTCSTSGTYSSDLVHKI